MKAKKQVGLNGDKGTHNIEAFYSVNRLLLIYLQCKSNNC